MGFSAALGSANNDADAEDDDSGGKNNDYIHIYVCADCVGEWVKVKCMIQSLIYEVDEQSPSPASPWQAWPLLLAEQLDSEPGIFILFIFFVSTIVITIVNTGVILVF